MAAGSAAELRIIGAMVAILIIAHAPLASALKEVAMHTYPECAAQLEVLDVGPHEGLDAVEARARGWLAACGQDGALVLTDACGGSPSNVAQRLADQARVRVVAGVNVPMLWRCLCYTREPLDALAQRALGGGRTGVTEVEALPAQTVAGT